MKLPQLLLHPHHFIIITYFYVIFIFNCNFVFVSSVTKRNAESTPKSKKHRIAAKAQ
jgi:hypothetical protein